MNKKEFFAAVNLYKRQSEIVQWKNDFLPKAIAASAKEILAHSTGNDEDAMAFANELASYTKKLDWLPDSEFSKISSLIEHSAEEMAEKYGATFDDGVLEHGTKWKDHKYIRIENGRYIYPEDLKPSSGKGVVGGLLQKVGQKIGTSLANKVIGDSNDQTRAAAAAINKAQADGMKRTASINESKASSVPDARKENAEKQRQETRAKEVQKPLTGSLYSARQAQAEGEAQQRWKNAKEATKRMEENKARTINRVADLESGLAKEEFDGELRIRKQALADANVDQKSIDDAKARKAEAVRAKDDNSKNQAQREGEAMQAWKNQQEAKRKEYEADIKKMASESISAWASGEDDNNGGKYAAKVNEIGDKYVWDKSITADKMISDYANAVYEEYLKKKDSLSPEVRTRIENALSNIENKYKPKKVTHSFDLSTKEGYYAAVAEYKRKKA